MIGTTKLIMENAYIPLCRSFTFLFRFSKFLAWSAAVVDNPNVGVYV